MTQRAIDGPYIYFVTTNTTNRESFFVTPERAIVLGNIIRTTSEEFQFLLFGYCILPDHVHLLVRKDGTNTLSKFMKHVKGRLWRSVSKGHGHRFWQPRFNFRIIENEQRLIHTIHYMKYNYRKSELPEFFGEQPFVYFNRHEWCLVWE